MKDKLANLQIERSRAAAFGLCLTAMSWVIPCSYAEIAMHLQLDEHVGLTFAAQPISYRVALKPGALQDVKRCTVRDANGQPVTAQFRILDRHPDGSVRHLRLMFVSELKAFEKKQFTLDDSGHAPPDDGRLVLTRDKQRIVLSSPLAAVEIPALDAAFSDRNPPPAEIPPPVQRIRGKQTWYGHGRLLTDSYLWLRRRRVHVADDGPICKRVAITYEFANGVPSATGAGNASLYTVEVALYRGEELVRVNESFSLPFTDLSHFEFAFDFSPGLHPDTTVCRPLTSHAGPAWGLGSLWDLRPYKGDMFPIRFDRDNDTHGFLTPWGVGASSWVHYGCFNSGNGDAAEMVGIIDTAPENWHHQAYYASGETWKLVQNPHAFFSLKPIKDVRLSTGRDGNLTAHFRISTGTREWAFFIGGPVPRRPKGEAREWFTRKTWHYAWNNLDRIKDYVLEWPADPAIEYPRLFASAADYAARRKIYDAWSGDAPLPDLADPAHREKLKETLLTGLEHAVHQFSGRIGPPHHGVAAALLQGAILSDLLGGSGTLTAAEEKLVRARLAYLTYVASRRSYWAPGEGYAANPNMSSHLYAAIGLAGLALPDHPSSAAWVQAYLQQADREIANWMSDDGAWIESVHYVRAAWNFHRILFAALAHLGVRNYYRNPRVLRFLHWYFDMQTPPDPEYHGQRHLQCLDNAYIFEPIEDFAYWARGIRQSAPDFAGELMWMWRQQGFGTAAERKGKEYRACGANNWHFWGRVSPYYKLALEDPTIPQQQPAPRKGHAYRGFGATMQAHFGGNRETKLFFRMGQFYSHMDMDAGHFVLWGRGAPLILDHGYGEFHPWFHNRIVVNHMWDDDLGEVNAFFAGWGSSFLTGEVTIQHLSLREHPAVKEWPMAPEPLNGRSPRTWWQRRLVMMKDADPAGTTYLALRDVVDGELPTEWVLWVYGNVADFQSQPIRVRGACGVDLLVYLLDADRGHVNTGVIDLSKKPIRRRKQTLIHLRRAPGRGVLALLVPIAPEQTKLPVVTPLPDATGMAFATETRRDWIFLPSARQACTADGITFRGSVGSFSRLTDHRHVMLDADGRLTADGSSLHSSAPGEFDIYADHLDGLVRHPDAEVRLTLGGRLASRATELAVGDVRTKLEGSAGTVTLRLPPGETSFRVRLRPAH